jgi:hypothetical protein
MPHGFVSASPSISKGGMGRSRPLSRHKARLQVRCDSERSCTARLSVTTRARVGPHHRGKTVTCVKTRVHIAARHTKKISARVTAKCRALLRRAHRHTISARLRARPSTGQRGINVKISLRR